MLSPRLDRVKQFQQFEFFLQGDPSEGSNESEGSYYQNHGGAGPQCARKIDHSTQGMLAPRMPASSLVRSPNGLSRSRISRPQHEVARWPAAIQRTVSAPSSF